MSKLRVVLAEDHHVVRAGLRSLIDSQDDMEVIAEAADGESACRAVVDSGPDVAILDISMPILGGVQAAECIRRDRPDVKILALTVHEDRGYLDQIMKAGADGYVLKRAAVVELIQAIRTVGAGGRYLDAATTGMVVNHLGGRERENGSAEVSSLSDREEETLRLVARGFTNREIAAQLDVSVKTIETHKARAMEKLKIDSRAGIVSYAIRAGWLTDF